MTSNILMFPMITILIHMNNYNLQVKCNANVSEIFNWKQRWNNVLTPLIIHQYLTNSVHIQLSALTGDGLLLSFVIVTNNFHYKTFLDFYSVLLIMYTM